MVRGVADDIADPDEAKKTLPLKKLAEYDGKGCTEFNIVRHTGVELDYDGEQMQPEEAQRILKELGMAALIVTTPSHTDEAPRWRVFAPLFEPMDNEHRRMLAHRINRVFGGVLAHESSASGQRWFVGRLRGRPKPRVLMIDGEYADRAPKLPVLLHDPDQRSDRGARREIEDQDELALSQKAFHYSDEEKRVIDAMEAIPEEVWSRHGSLKVTGEKGWVDIVAAAHGAWYGSSRGLAITRRISQEKCGDSFDEDELVGMWGRRMGRDRPGKVDARAGTIFWLAENEGTWSHAKYDRKRDRKAREVGIAEGDRRREEIAAAPKSNNPYPFLVPSKNASFVVHLPHEVLDDDDLTVVTEIWEDWIQAGTVGVLVATSTTGKSQFAAALAYRIAIGGTFLGKRVEKGPVLIITGENMRGVLRRNSLMFRTSGLAEVVPMSLPCSPLELEAEQRAELIAYVRQAGFRLIIIDTYNAVIRGDDTDPKTANEALAWVKELVDATGTETAAMVVHHTTKATHKAKGNAEKMAADYMGKGSYNLFTNADWYIPLYMDEGGTVRVVPGEARKVKEEAESIMDGFAMHREVLLFGRNQWGKDKTVAIMVEGPSLSAPPPREEEPAKPKPSPADGMALLKRLAEDGGRRNAIRAGRLLRFYHVLKKAFGKLPSFTSMDAKNALKDEYPPEDREAEATVKQIERALGDLANEFSLLDAVLDEPNKPKVYKVVLNTTRRSATSSKWIGGDDADDD